MTQPIDAVLLAHGQSSVVPPISNDPSFTAIVRTQGRRPSSLLEAIASLEAQIASNFDAIVVVHGDEATAARVGREIDGRDSPMPLAVISVSGGGRSAPLNAGLDAAEGDYVCFLDDDDLASPDWIAAFAAGAESAPGSIIRAVTGSQLWATDGGQEPLRPIGEVELPFADRFDLLAHLSHNETPLCSVAFPLASLQEFDLRFDDSLPVYEDWDLLVRASMLIGVTSIPEQTSLYRRLDHGNADTAVDEAIWHETHGRVIEKLSSLPVILPPGDAQRIAAAHFVAGGRSRHDYELEAAQAEISALTRSPVRWARAFAGRSRRAVQHRISARRP